MKVGFFPLDRRLKLVKHSWSPETIKEAVRLGVDVASYERAAAEFRGLTKLPMSKSSLAELVEEYGERLVTIQADEAEAMVKAPERGEEIVWRDMPEPDSDIMAASLDGAMVHLREEGWKEVRVATISAVETVVSMERDEEKEVHLTRHSYRAGLWEAKDFAKQQWAEGCRRGLEKAKQIVSVNDGAAWIWWIIAMCYAPCVEIIDWWHAVQKIWETANSLYGQGEQQTTIWAEQLKSLLWAGQIRSVLHQIRLACPRGSASLALAWPTISYLFHNRRRMNYQSYRQAGYPVGSGSVEAGCKVVMETRMKQAGMRWSRPRAQAMLALRSVLLSDRWDQVWPSLIPVLQLA